MTDFFLVGEIIKYFELKPGELFYYLPFVYRVKISIDYDLQSYFITIFGAKDVTRKEYILIQGVYVNINSFYHPQDFLQDCIDNEETIYFDILEQFLYIHFNHNVSPILSSVEYGKTIGFTNDTVRKFNNIDYDPYIISIPNYQEKIDPLKYVKQAFYGGNVIKNNTPTDLKNNSGRFDVDIELYGNDYNILIGKNGDEYNDLIGIAKTYISNSRTSFNELNLTIKDKREQENIKVPIDTFEISEFPDIDDDLVGKVKPDGYGYILDVPGICVNSKSTGNKLWYFCSEIALSGILKLRVQVKKDNNWITITPQSIDFENGIIELSIADSHIDGDSSKGLLEIKANGVFRNILDSLPPDIIRDMNERFLKITFNESNYNVTEWNEERQYLAPVGLYMDNQKNIFDWIGILQGSSTVGFIYRNEYGKRTIRLDNPNRNPVMNIESIDIINNNNLEKDDNADFFATHAIINYKKKYTESVTKNLTSYITSAVETNKKSSTTVIYYESEKYENRDYYNDVFKRHRKDQPIEIESLLVDVQDAIDKTYIIMEDQQKPRAIIKIILWGKEYYQLRLFDIINIEISYPGEEISKQIINWWVIDDNSTEIKEIGDIGKLYEVVDFSEKVDIINRREFLGWQRMQIIGRKPNFDNGTIELILRQRNFSDKFQEITDYIP